MLAVIFLLAGISIIYQTNFSYYKKQYLNSLEIIKQLETQKTSSRAIPDLDGSIRRDR
jgi:hypothetical protein